MRYSPSTRLAYYHIHKTGGLSFKQFLADLLPDLTDVSEWPHHALGDYFQMLRERSVNPDELRILTTIREPLAHVVSIYSFWRSSVEGQHGEHVEAARTLAFREFVDYYLGSQHPDCRVYDELLLVDGVLPANVRVLRLEMLEQDAQSYLNDELGLGHSRHVPHLNSSHHAPPVSYYDSETAAKVRRRYAWAFENGYYPLVERVGGVRVTDELS